MAKGERDLGGLRADSEPFKFGYFNLWNRPYLWKQAHTYIPADTGSGPRLGFIIGKWARGRRKRGQSLIQKIKKKNECQTTHLLFVFSKNCIFRCHWRPQPLTQSSILFRFVQWCLVLLCSTKSSEYILICVLVNLLIIDNMRLRDWNGKRLNHTLVPLPSHYLK